MLSFSKNRLIDIILKNGIVYAKPGQQFTLASGVKSSFYIDFSRVMMLPFGAVAVVDALLDHMKSIYSSQEHGGLPFDIIGGPSSGADSIIGAILPRLVPEINGFTIRKEPKSHGPDAGKMYDGYIHHSARALVIEDVTTSGQSVLKAVKEIEKQGATVTRIISLLDRQNGASELLKDYSFTSIVRLDELNIKQV